MDPASSTPEEFRHLVEQDADRWARPDQGPGHHGRLSAWHASRSSAAASGVWPSRSALHQRGMACDVYETVPRGARRSASASRCCRMRCASSPRWACRTQLEAAGIENLESVFFNRWGQFIYREPRGRHAGYALPEIGIHRGKLHRVLFDAVLRAAGRGRACTWTTAAVGDRSRTTAGVTLQLQDSAGRPRPPVARRRGHRLRRRQFRVAPPVLSRRATGLRRHQHLARRHRAPAHPHAARATCASAPSRPARW